MGLHAYLWYGYFTSEDSDRQQKAHGVEISFFRRAYNTGFSQALQFVNQIFCWFF